MDLSFPTEGGSDTVKPNTTGEVGDPGSNANRGRWRWILEPDGSHATVLSSPLAKRKRPPEPGTRAGSTTNGVSRPGFQRCSGGKEDLEKQRVVSKHGSTWYWLLAEDGSPDTGDNTRSPRAIGRKRQRLPFQPLFKNPSRYDCGRSDDSNILSEDDENDSDMLEDTDFDLPPIEDCQRWEKRFEQLVLYKQKHKTVDVPFRIPKLGGWVKWQRTQYKHRRLSKERIARLESVGFAWRLRKETSRCTWTEMCDRLLIYRKQNNTVNVPISVPKLGNWVQVQRKKHKDGKLSREQVSRLESMGFQWELREPHEKKWDNMYGRLVDYKKKFENTRVPKSYKKDPQLGDWVKTQRYLCKEKCRVDLLNKIGFEWQPLNDTWMRMYNHLVSYKKKFRNTRVPKNFKEDPQLGHWVKTQRGHCKEKHRVDLLNKIGFEWDPFGKRTKPLPF